MHTAGTEMNKTNKKPPMLSVICMVLIGIVAVGIGLYLTPFFVVRSYEYDSRGHRIEDDDHLLLFNAHYEEIAFQLPPLRAEISWQTLLDTSYPLPNDAPPLLHHGREPYALQGRSLAWLLAVKPHSSGKGPKKFHKTNNEGGTFT